MRKTVVKCEFHAIFYTWGAPSQVPTIQLAATGDMVLCNREDDLKHFHPTSVLNTQLLMKNDPMPSANMEKSIDDEDEDDDDDDFYHGDHYGRDDYDDSIFIYYSLITVYMIINIRN